jgi:phosphohistidine phosphatase
MKGASNRIGERKCLLLLARHGRAAPKNAGLTDFERILTQTGLEESGCVAAATKARVHSDDLMLSSPADRALETAHVYARHLKYPVQKIQIVEKIYSAGSIRSLVAYIRSLEHIMRTVALFGHNPLLDELAAYFVPGFSQTVPKSAVLGIEFETSSWADISKGKGHLQFFLVPAENGARPADRLRRSGK